MIKVLRFIFIFAIIFVALFILKGLVDNLTYLNKENQLKSLLDSQFSGLALDDLPQLSLPNSKEKILVSNGIYVSNQKKSDEGIKDWRKIEYWIKDEKDFSYLDIDLISFYAPEDAQTFYRAEKHTLNLEFLHQFFKQKEGGSFTYYISKAEPKKINLEGPPSDYPGYASFVIISKGSIFIGINELASFEKNNYKLNVLN